MMKTNASNTESKPRKQAQIITVAKEKQSRKTRI